jgi:NDP-sugar pyrophosphorylase family protein
MKTILLAGGQSKRVKPVADKCFVRVCGKFLIQWQLEALAEAGFVDVVIVGNSGNLEKLRSLGSRVEGQEITVVEQVDLNGGMKAAMDAAKEEVIGEEGIMVVSSNDVVENSLWSVVGSRLNEDTDSDGFLVGYKVNEYFPGGYLEVGEQGLIHSIVEKPGAGNEPSDLVNLVVHVHRDVQALYAALEAASSSSDDVYEVALQQLFSEQKKYSVIQYDGFWQPVKYPWHLLKLNEYFLSKLERSISPDAQIAESANINGNVVIESGVRVFDQVVINGPAYIGKDSIVGNFGMVRGSSLGEKCVVGSFTEIARSLMQDEVWTHKNYVGDSVIGSNVSFGSGTVTGNLRLDEKEIDVRVNEEAVGSGSNKLGLITGDDIRVGINTSFMPGAKIGSNTQVGAHLFVAQDIPENSYVKSGTGEGLDIRENRERVERRG